MKWQWFLRMLGIIFTDYWKKEETVNGIYYVSLLHWLNAHTFVRFDDEYFGIKIRTWAIRIQKIANYKLLSKIVFKYLLGIILSTLYRVASQQILCNAGSVSVQTVAFVLNNSQDNPIKNLNETLQSFFSFIARVFLFKPHENVRAYKQRS